MNIEIANRLVQLRKQNNLSQEELAAKIGISRQAVSKWERAEASPDTDNLILLSKLYNISLDNLLKTEDEAAAAPDAQEVSPPPAGLPQEEIKEAEEQKNKTFLQRLPYPAIITMVYLILGFVYGLWHPGWLLYLTIPIYYWFADEMQKKK